jgi:hypothetical protein
MDGGISSISAMGMTRVNGVRFSSTHLKNLSASPTGGPLAVVSSLVASCTASGRGCRLVLTKSIGRTGPTFVHNIYIVVKYSDAHKK